MSFFSNAANESKRSIWKKQLLQELLLLCDLLPCSAGEAQQKITPLNKAVSRSGVVALQDLSCVLFQQRSRVEVQA